MCTISIWFQDLLFLTCSHPENRNSLTKMEEWPEWILEVLISNFEVLLLNCALKLFYPIAFLKKCSNGTKNTAILSTVNSLILSMGMSSLAQSSRRGKIQRSRRITLCLMQNKSLKLKQWRWTYFLTFTS